MSVQHNRRHRASASAADRVESLSFYLCLVALSLPLALIGRCQCARVYIVLTLWWSDASCGAKQTRAIVSTVANSSNQTHAERSVHTKRRNATQWSADEDAAGPMGGLNGPPIDVTVAPARASDKQRGAFLYGMISGGRMAAGLSPRISRPPLSMSVKRAPPSRKRKFKAVKRVAWSSCSKSLQHRPARLTKAVA